MELNLLTLLVVLLVGWLAGWGASRGYPSVLGRLLLKWRTRWQRKRRELVRSSEERRGTLIVGAGPMARLLARMLAPARPVWLVDSNPARCHTARRQGFHATCGNALVERVLADAHAAEVGTFVGMTGNTEVNALAANIARSTFLVPEILLVSGVEGAGSRATLEHVGGTALFGGGVDIADWDYRIADGHAVERQAIVEADQSAADWLAGIRSEGEHVPVAVIRADDRFPFDSRTQLRKGDVVVLLVHAFVLGDEQDEFDRLLAEAPVIDFDGAVSLERFFARVAEIIADRLRLSRGEVFRLLWEREAAASTVLSPGLAIPHVLLHGDTPFSMLVARCRHGVQFPGQVEPVTAVFVLTGTAGQRTQHLRALSAIAQIANQPSFESRWREATGPGALRRLLTSAARRRFGIGPLRLPASPGAPPPATPLPRAERARAPSEGTPAPQA